MLEGHRAGVDPDAEDPLLLAYGGIFARALQHDDDVVLADREKQLVGIAECAEDRQIRAGEIGGDGDFAGRGTDLHRLAHRGRGGRLVEQHLRLGAEGRKQEAGCEDQAVMSHRPDPSSTTE